MNEATARIKINNLLEAAGWRFFADGNKPANICLETGVTIKASDLDFLGNDFEKTSTGFIDFLLLDAKGFPLIVLEAKSEDKNPLVGKEQARKYARSQNCRFVILSNGNLHYFWDLERGNPHIITSFPTPDSVSGYRKITPNPQRLITEQVSEDYIVLTHRPNYASEAAWKNEAERPGFIKANNLRFLRDYQLRAVHALQRAVRDGGDRFLFEMATGTGKTLTAAAVIKLFLRSGNASRVLFLVDRLELENQAHTVLDPACGTAGFLISSYKHILAANTDPQGASTLTPDDKGRLAANFKGYDISPDMVRLSLANMYLHGFTDPHIFEYDTLTSEERWNEYADVILANPPFMSPKGGIRPHNRFSVKSKRSEVLFVDYMAEHLMPSGRAGIIVPEGIIFQSQNAYKQLRKMLVEEYLIAVVSLPAGVFNPYSSVKTSILILDKSLAKKMDRIAFFKVENDGFDLGAQRRLIDKNDLPQALAEIAKYMRLLRAGGSLDDFQPALGLLAEKEKIAANWDYNLSGERYRESITRATCWPMVALGEVCELVRGVTYSRKDEVRECGYQVLRANNIARDTSRLDLSEIRRISYATKFPDEKKLRKSDIFICLASGSKSHIGKVAFIADDMDYYFGGFMGAIRVKPKFLSPAYLFHQLSQSRFNDFLREQITGANINNLGSKLLYQFQIPIPHWTCRRKSYPRSRATRKSSPPTAS